MRNKRTLQRGLALLLAGGMALSNLGAAPVLAEEYGTATEVTQAAPDGEAATDTTTNGDTDLSEGSESASPTEEKVDSSGSAAEDTPAAESDHEEAPAEEKTDAETPADKAPDTDNEDPTDEEVPAGDADSDDKESANEDTVEDADADYSADVFNVDEINEIATYAADTTKTVADGMTQLLHEDFSNCTDNFGFSSKAAVTNEALVLTNNSTGQTVIKQFDKTVEGQSKVQLSYDWKISLGNQSTKAGIEYRDTYGRLVFVVMGSRSDKGEYKLRYATEGVDSVSSSCGNSNNDPHWQYADLKNNTVYHIDATADFTAGTLQLKITDSDGAEVVNVANASITAHNLAKMVSCSYYCGASATQTVDNFQLYGSNNAGEFPLAGKTIVAFGDSIVAGHKYTAASFVNFVAEKEGMTVLQKNAVNGATIMDANYSGGRILTQIQNTGNSTPDYVIFDGGTNDAEYLTKHTDVQIGDATSTDEATFAGSFRATIQKLKEKYPNAKLVYVAVHKLGSRETTMQENLRKVELAICEELGVTVSDVYTSGLDTTDANMKNTYTFDNTTSAGVPGTNGSGTHPNFAAIEKYYVPTVSATLRTAQNTTPTEPEGPTVEYTPSIDFAKVADLNDDTQIHGWTYSNGGGTTELVTDAEMGQVLKMSRTSDGGETALIYDGLNITESDTRYVTVTAEMKLDKNGYAHQYSIPYIFNNSGAVAYSLFTNDSATKYQSHVNGKNTTDAGALTTDTWQTVRMDIDMQSDTFRVSVDGVMSLRNAKARTATDNLQKIKFYADSWNRGTLYIKSVSVTASNTDPFAPHTTAATYYVSPNGDDSKDGKTEQTAWKTIARVNQDTYIPGDKILFERGGEWENTTLQPQGSGSADAHITIGAYGDETKHMPRIAANGKVNDALYLYNQEYWEICNLDISNTVDGCKMVAGDTNPTGNVTARDNSEGEKLGDYRGIHIAGRDVPSLQGFNIHNVRVHDVSGIVTWIGDTGVRDAGIGNNYGFDGSKRTGGILIESLATTTNTPTIFSNITIADSEFVNNSFGGITIKQWNNGKGRDGSTGWANRNSAGGAPDYYDPNWKPHTNILITGNYINQGASAYACNGIYLCGVKDSVVEKNLLEHIGTCGIELFFADNVAIQYNEVFDVRHKGGGQDSNAIDPDWRATNILIQYNYVHDCGEGLLLCGMKFNSGIIRYNLIQDCLYSYVHYSMGGGYFQFSNNVFYRSKDGNGTSNFDPWGGGTASYVNNVFYDGKGTGFGFSGGTSFSYKNNAYYGTPACWKDSSPIMLSEDPFVGTAPSMSRLGNAATGALLEANGLMPKTGSALVAAGASTDATGTALTDGLFAKGSRFNFTSLAKAYGSIVPMAATAYPVFDATDSNATLNTSYTHTAASTTAPTIGLFEVSMPEDAVYLRGTVSDDVSPCSNAKITVTVNGKTVETTTNASGTYTITEGLTAGEATVTAVVEGRDTLTKTITLAGGKVNILDIAVPMPAMPNAYSDTLISEAFDENAGALAFNTKATVADGRLALSPGNAASSYADFAAEIQSRTAVDFSFDFKYQNGTNKGGFQFRDSDGRLLFAMCVKTADGGNTMRTPAAASLVGGTQMSEPKWVDHTADTNKTYVVRVHADFEAGTVSYQLKDKATDKVVLQELNIPTNAKNLARMYSSNWYQAKTQYIDNFVLTARSNEPEPVVVDKTALQKAIDANTGKVETDYTAETWADFAKTLADAKAVLADENATQNDIDAAAKALTDAAAALKVKPTEEPKPTPTVETKVVTDDLSDNNIPDSLKKAGYDTPEKITEKLKLESSKKLSSDNIVVYEVKLQVSKDGVTWFDATAENFPKNGLEISFTLPNGITAETAAQYDFIVSHMKDSDEVELLTPALKDGKLVVTVSSLSPFGISWKLKEQPKPSEEPKPTQAPTATPAPTAAPAASDASSNSSNSSGTTSAPASTAAPKATAAPTAPAAVIPQTADSFPLVLLAMLALCSAAALTGLVICRKKKH